MTTLGKAAFIVGVFFAIFGGIWGGIDVPTNRAVIAILIVAGVIIGLLVLIGMWSTTTAFWPVFHLSHGLAENVVGLVVAFALLMAPSAIIVAVKTVIAVARPD